MKLDGQDKLGSALSVVCLYGARYRYGKRAPTLTVVTDVWPPFRMLAQNDEFHGLDIDILRQLQARSGIALTLKRVPWDGHSSRCRQVRRT